MAVCLVLVLGALLAGCASEKFESMPGLNVGTLSGELARDWGLKFGEPSEVTPEEGGQAWSTVHGEGLHSSTGAKIVCEIGYYSPEEVWSVSFYVQWDEVLTPVDVNSLDQLSRRYLTYCLGKACPGLAGTARANVDPGIGEADTSRRDTINGTNVSVWSSAKLCTAAVEIVRKSTSDATGD